MEEGVALHSHCPDTYEVRTVVLTKGSEAGNGAWDGGKHVENFFDVLLHKAVQETNLLKTNFWCTCKLHNFPQHNTQLPHWILYTKTGNKRVRHQI